MDKITHAHKQDQERTGHSAMRRVFMTGITGLLGTNLANELLEQGYQITAIARNPEKYIGNRAENLRLIKMNLWDDYDDYLKQADLAVHIAAETATDLLKYADYEEVNYKATLRLFEKAICHGVPKFIFVSTANTIGYGNLKMPGTETQKIKKPFDRLFYAQSKLKAENYLLSRSKDIEIKILNPTFMIGPYDSKPSSGKIILMGLNKKWIFYPPGGKNFVPVKDVADAVIRCFHNGKTGERYLVAGENLSYRDFFKKLKHITRQRSLLIPIPKLLLLALGLTGSCLRMLTIRTSLSLVNMKALCVKNYYSNYKSLTDLKVPYSSLDNAIKECVDYFQNK